ncbi:MAG: agmatinase [Thermoplasmata archaeon]|nr:MAG: agmatinase [Thermoplasmata archaeon]
MTTDPILFADAEASFSDARFVIFGGPFDGTVSHRAGTKDAPAAIRRESYNFETYLYEYDIELTTIAVHDAGDLSFLPETRAALDAICQFTKKIAAENKFPIMLGGEHSLSVGALKGLMEGISDTKSKPPVGVVVLDAHLDYRNEYENERFSHACSARRLAELVGIKNIVTIGVRSMSGEERKDALKHGLKFYDMNTVAEMGMKLILEDVRDLIEPARIYLSMDMDAFDPAFAPGVGNPEPFGLTPVHVRECIEQLAPHLAGFDIMETSPPYDNGNTAALAARFVRNVIGLVGSK